MLLPLEEVDQFFRLHRSLMFFVNRRLEVIDKKIATPEAYSGLPPETRMEVHKALLEHTDLIDAFADENPFRLSTRRIWRSSGRGSTSSRARSTPSASSRTTWSS